MRKLMSLGILMATFVILVGCTTTTLTTYDPITKQIASVEVKESDIVDKITQSTKDKTLIVWRSGWAAYVSASPGTTDDPTPHGKLFAGKYDDGYMSIHKDHVVKDIPWDDIAKIISATRGNLSVTASGINDSTSSAAMADK